MSAVNRVLYAQDCPNCDNAVQFEIQFKYGEIREYTYAEGGRIRFPASGAVARDRKCIVADGIAQPCPVCGYSEDSDYEVWLEDGRITAVKPATGRFDFAQVQQPFVVVEGDCDASTAGEGLSLDRRSEGSAASMRVRT